METIWDSFTTALVLSYVLYYFCNTTTKMLKVVDSKMVNLQMMLLRSTIAHAGSVNE